jgi:hypothetical protein
MGRPKKAGNYCEDLHGGRAIGPENHLKNVMVAEPSILVLRIGMSV